MRHALWLGLFLILAGCATPPPSAYVAGGHGGKPAASLAIGRNTVGEACTEQAEESGTTDIYCGTWEQPSAKLREGDAASAGDLARLAADSPWRAGIDRRFDCAAPVSTTILDGRPTELLSCTRRLGGWPQVALVALVAGHVWYADGVLAAAPVMQRAIGVRAGVLRADAAPQNSAADALLARRLAAQAVRSGDIGSYDALMAAGTRANLADDPGAAEVAFRAALALQRKALGANNPNTATTVMTLALQLSNEGRTVEAGALFHEAENLAPKAADPTAPARLLHYRGLDALNRGQLDESLGLLRGAEAAYAALTPADTLHPAAKVNATAAFSRTGVRSPLVTNQVLLADPAGQTALLGLIEARRNEAVVLGQMGRVAESRAILRSATALAEDNGLARPILAARLYRTSGLAAAGGGDSEGALSDLGHSIADFDRSLPDSKSLADTYLLRAAELRRHGDNALTVCRNAVAGLIALKAGTTPRLLAPCLAAYADAAAHAPAPDQQAVLAEMFVAAQLAQGGITSEQIAQATARLGENARDPKVAEAIRSREDSVAALQKLYRQRDALAAAAGPGDTAAGQPSTETAALDARIKAAQTATADSDAALQAAAPNYGQLVQQVAPASAVFAALHPHEALVAIVLGPTEGWTFLLHDGRITLAPVAGGLPRMAALVHELRAGIELTGPALPTFNVAAAREIYTLALGGISGAMTDVSSLVVAPSGPLLSIPFEVLLTGPADDAHLAEAPWLMRKLTLSHVPSPSNFVGLRKIAGGSRATVPWFGFGDFVPPTLAQTEASFPGGACADSARLLASLPRLPYAGKELAAARALLGGSGDDELLGARFTAPAVLHMNLKNVRILHFAAHALLPAELRCQSQPAIITSVPAGAANVSGALLTSSEVTGMDLDANLVILSACNSGGPGGSTAGESLSGLARAFFFAGARALLVTHWDVNDQTAAYLIAETLGRLRADPGAGVAAALRASQLAVLAQAGKGLPAEIAHPFFWAPFAVIGEGGGRGTTLAGEGSFGPAVTQNTVTRGNSAL